MTAAADPRTSVLFVCTHNSARSQLAEGLLRARHGDRYEAFSAGTVARGVHPLAVEALRDAGIDPSAQSSKTIDDLGDQDFDIVVTVCDNALEACPYLPARVRNVHHSFRDPSAVEGTENDRRAAFATVRDEIAAWIDGAFGTPEPATEADLPGIRALLEAAALPVGDLPEADRLSNAEQPWAVILLRYFNPVGAHKSGLIGEDPKDIPNNLMPYISQVAVGRREKLSVFGDDYDTIDGTGVRDYIHVVDLAKGHVKAVDNLLSSEAVTGVEAINLGTGNGTSVLQLVNTFSEVNDTPVPYEIAPRRPGDVAACYANATKAKQILQWETELDIAAMVKDTWHWQSSNPNGYSES